MPQPASAESRNRLVFHLPLNNEGQELAVLDIIQYLRNQRSEKTGIGGYTVSRGGPSPVFKGAWWSDAKGDSKKGTWIEDGIVMCMLDVLNPTPDEPFSVIGIARALKAFVAQAYEKRAGVEEEIWVIVHSVQRIV